MPKQKDLRLERQIHDLRAHGGSLRSIARDLHVSPSTVSRYLRKEVNRKLLETLTAKVEETQGTLKLAFQALEAVANTILFPGNPTMVQKQRLSDALKHWPGEYRHG